jgi:hypothetical protein
MEYRIVLSKKEANELMVRLSVLSTSFVRDCYTGEKRIRTDKYGDQEKVYVTPVSGVIYRYSSDCELDGAVRVWFEYKWTDKTDRFEMEFEGDIPKEFQGRENIKGWDILT